MCPYEKDGIKKWAENRNGVLFCNVCQLSRITTSLVLFARFQEIMDLTSWLLWLMCRPRLHMHVCWLTFSFCVFHTYRMQGNSGVVLLLLELLFHWGFCWSVQLARIYKWNWGHLIALSNEGNWECWRIMLINVHFRSLFAAKKKAGVPFNTYLLNFHYILGKF